MRVPVVAVLLLSSFYAQHTTALAPTSGVAIDLTDDNFDALLSATPSLPWLVIIGAPWCGGVLMRNAQALLQGHPPHRLALRAQASASLALHASWHRTVLSQHQLSASQVPALQRAGAYDSGAGGRAGRASQCGQGIHSRCSSVGSWSKLVWPQEVYG